MQAFSISKDFSVVHQRVGNMTKPAAPAPSIDHVLIIDVSGSMSYDLPKLRQHIKTKIAKILRPEDTLTLIWFSGRGECGVLLEEVTAANLLDLKSIHDAIDRWLRPVGMTGFLEPIQQLGKLKDNGRPKNVVFMSDGCDNQWPRDVVLNAIKAVKPTTATIVEYGYYADRAFLAQMASAWGAQHIFAENFVNYEPKVEAAITRKVIAGSSVMVEVGKTVGDIAIALVDSEVIAYAVTNGKVEVPSHVQAVVYVVEGKRDNDCANDIAMSCCYALAAMFAPRMRSDVIWPLLKLTGDVAFIEQYANCFGKQAYSAFEADLLQAVHDRARRLTKGYDSNLVPRDDAFTILDLLQFIADSDTAKVDIENDAFDYKRISRQKVDANTRLTADEKETLDTLSADLTKTRDVAKLKAIREKIDALTNKPVPLEFEETPQKGYDLKSLVLNEDRPNVSFRIQRKGHVDISRRTEGTEFETALPVAVETFTFRTYTVIKDGIRNLKKLPVVGLSLIELNKLEALWKEGRVARAAVWPEATEWVQDGNVVFDLTKIPIVNGQSVRQSSAEEVFRVKWDMIKAQAKLKCFKAKRADLYDKKAEGFAKTYGEKASAWLGEQGVTANNGFSPRVVALDPTDVYMAKVLEVKVKGYSDLPSVTEVIKRRTEKKKPTATGALMLPTIEQIELAQTTKHSDEGFRDWLDENIKELTKEVRGYQYQLARTKFAVIVGQTWFKEFKSLDENTLKLTFDGIELDFTAVLREVEEKC